MADGCVRRCRPLLGTFVEIAVPAGHEATIEAAFQAVAKVHARMSYHEEMSDLTALRRSPAGAIVAVDPWTVAVLRRAIALHQRSASLFDVTIGRELVGLGYLPADVTIDVTAMIGTTVDIEIIDDERVCCHSPMLIDLGGIAKGFAVDRAIDVLMADGIERGTVNAGGDLRVIGREVVALRGIDNMVEGAINVVDAAVATSANRSTTKRTNASDTAPHIGASRMPLQADGVVTIIADDCMTADAMTKIALADPALAQAMLEELGGAIVARPDLALAA